MLNKLTHLLLLIPMVVLVILAIPLFIVWVGVAMVWDKDRTL